MYPLIFYQTSEYDFSNVKEEMDCQAIPQGGKAPYVDDNMYMKVCKYKILIYVPIAESVKWFSFVWLFPPCEDFLFFKYRLCITLFQ